MARRVRKHRAARIDGDEPAALAAAMDALAEAVDVVHERLRTASPKTRALIDAHEPWPENFIWTDGSQVAKAARRIAALLRRHIDVPGTGEPGTRSVGRGD